MMETQPRQAIPQLKGKIALITGSSRGIGAEIAKLFASEGARIVLHGRDKDALETIYQQIIKNGGDAIKVMGDVTRSSDIDAMRQEIEARMGPVDILVANAGGRFVEPGPLEEISESDWHAAINGNLTSAFLTIKTFLPSMKQRKYGHIVTISSAAARKANAAPPIPYAAAKAGLIMLTKNLATQVGPYGIRVNSISPGAILTERNRDTIPNDQQYLLAKMYPLQRLGQPDDVAQAALYLVSDRSAWITGIILDVAGGDIQA